MRTKLQGRRSILLWVQYSVVLLALAGFGFAVQSWRLLPTRGGVEATPTSVGPATLVIAPPAPTPSPSIDTVAATQVLPNATATPDRVATTVAETVTAASVVTVTPIVPPTATLAVVTLITPSTATAASADLAQLRTQVLAATRSSRIRNAYPQQTTQLVDAILAHLDDFQLPALGVTAATMQQALNRPDVGDRLNALVQEVWADWRGIAGQKGFDLNNREPTYAEHNVSPFRQLIIRLIQNRQGTLADYQQHGLHNFLTRGEDASAWSSNIDGVIGAVNRESFQWP